jgi:SPP1 gp7 family putative phage head morphogenesis protein
MADRLYDIHFWKKEQMRFWEKIGASLLSVLFQGTKDGEEILEEGARVFIDWDVLNTKVVKYLQDYRLKWIDGIVETTRKDVMAQFQAWMEAGESMPMLEKRLEPIFGDARAERIAVTETTRLYADGNKLAWDESGMVGGERWNTAEDELVCPYCGELDGKEVSLGNAWLSLNNLPIEGPPAHINCRCWLTPVVDTEGVRDEIRKALENG